MAADPTLLLHSGILLANAALFARVGDLTVAPREGPRERWGVTLFATWWIALGVAFGFQGFSSLLYALGLYAVTLQVTIVLGTMAALAVGLCGLSYSVTYMLTGRRLLAPLAAYHAALLAAFVVLLALSRPDGVVSASWGARLTVEQPHPLMPILLAVLFVPPLGAGLACLAFARRLAPSHARTRFFAVGLSVLLLSMTAMALEVPGDAAQPLRPVGPLLLLLAAVAVVVAYEPPRWLRRALASHA